MPAPHRRARSWAGCAPRRRRPHLRAIRSWPRQSPPQRRWHRSRTLPFAAYRARPPERASPVTPSWWWSDLFIRPGYRLMDEQPIRILLVDDHASSREPLAFLLDREPDLTVIGQAATLA